MLFALTGYSQRRKPKKSRQKAKTEKTITEKAPIDIPEKYRAIFLGTGPRFLNTDPGEIQVNYIDNSPSMDELSTTTVIEDGYTNLGIQLGFKWGRYKGISHALTIDVSVGDNFGGLFTYGLGYSIPKMINDRVLVIRPSVYVGFANYGFNVGSIENNAGFIQIEETQYTDPELDVLLRSQVLLYGPQLDAYYMFSDKIGAFFTLSYDIGSTNDRPTLEFSQPGGDKVTAVELEGDNPNVIYNGETLTSLPYNASGLRASLGISYVWNKY